MCPSPGTRSGCAAAEQGRTAALRCVGCDADDRRHLGGGKVHPSELRAPAPAGRVCVLKCAQLCDTWRAPLSAGRRDSFRKAAP